MLTPIEIQGKTFKNGRGYKKEDIDEFLSAVGRDYEILYKENLEYKDKLNTLTEGLSYYKSIENTLQKALVLAEKTSNDTTSNAEKKAEAIEEKARLKAENIEAEAKAEAEKILSDSRKELSKLEMKIVSMAQEYEKYRAQFRQMAKAQIEILDGAAYQIDFKAQDINTAPIQKEREGGISLFLQDAKRVKEHKAESVSSESTEDIKKDLTEGGFSAEPVAAPASEAANYAGPAESVAYERADLSENINSSGTSESDVSEGIDSSGAVSAPKDTEDSEGQTLNDIFERLKNKTDVQENKISDKNNVPLDTTDVWTPDLQRSSSPDFTFYQTDNMKFTHIKKENHAMEETTDFEFIKEEDT